MTQLAVAYVIETGRQYIYRTVYDIVSPKDEDDSKSTDVTYVTLTTRELAQQFITDVWGDDKSNNFEIRENRLIVGFVDLT